MNDGPLDRLRHIASVLVKDWARYRRALQSPGDEYLALCNRRESLEPAPTGAGYRCTWQWTSELHAPKYLPSLGADLMRRALRDHPIRKAPAPLATNAPDVSYVIGHRGAARIPQLLATLDAIAGQKGAAVECIVVEQDDHPQLRGQLPPWVRYFHTPLPQPDLAYCRSWAFNFGVRQAAAGVLVLHDNDMLLPCDHAAQVVKLVQQGYEVINLKRFVFYLAEAHSQRVLAGEAGLLDAAPESIVQNLEGGGSVAITRSAYDAIGGFDEAFVGWGGEDVEFWERAASRHVWPYAWLPLVHLWHSAQPGKTERQSETLRLYHERSRTPVELRIARLRGVDSGALSGPNGGNATF